MARKGYYGGDPEKVERARVDYVMAALRYELFVADYEAAYFEANKPDA